MAERRMFAKAIVNSARFLRMPPTSRLLYYDLGMAADDDGIVEAFTVMRTTGATEDDLRVLAAKGFVRVLNDDMVTHITDWQRNNLIKKDRYHPSIHADLLVQVTPGTQMEPSWNPNGTQMEPEVRLGKVRLGEDRVGEGRRDAPGTQMEPGWNPPTPEEVRQYMDEYTSGRALHVDTARASERFWNHCAGKGWTVQHWRPLAASWIEEDARKVQSNPALGYEQRKLTDEDFAGVLINFDKGATP